MASLEPTARAQAQLTQPENEDSIVEPHSTFEGQAFHPDLPNGRGSGTIHAEPGTLRFVPKGAEAPLIKLPFDGLDLRLGGASDRILFFTHQDHDGITVYTPDHRILAHPAMSSQASIIAQVEAVRRRKTMLRLSSVSILGVLLLAVVGLVVAWGPLIGWVTEQVPPELEVRLGEVAFSQIKLTTVLLEDDALEDDLALLAAPLLAALPETGYAFDLHLADDPTLNAFALPGGHVVVHSGLILKAETPEEVLGVLGHELAHVTERHSLRQLTGTAGVFVVAQTLLGDLSGLAAVLADSGTKLLTLGFSRDHELEADSVGWSYLLSADIDPRGMIAFFETLNEQQHELTGENGESIDTALSFLSTHPATAERIETLQLKLDSMAERNFPEMEFNFSAFKEKINRAATLEEEETESAVADQAPETDSDSEDQ